MLLEAWAHLFQWIINMPYSITTKDGITINNIPDNVPHDDSSLKERVTKLRAGQLVQDSNMLDKFGHYAVDNTLGFIKGASDIGTTLLRPVDAALNATGITDTTNKQRKESLGQFFNDHADTDSLAFKGGDLAAGIAGTAGAGGVLAKPLMAAAPSLGAAAPYAARLAKALESGGLAIGEKGASTLANTAANAAIRTFGGAANGAASAGLIDPESAGVGAGIGAAIPALGKVVGSAGRLINSATKPLLESGKNKIIADMLLKKAGTDPNAVIANLEKSTGNTLGFNPTVGQAANNADLATLERVIRDKNPELADVATSQNEALANALRGIGGDDVARQWLVDARESATKPLYDAAMGKNVSLTPELQSLMQRPSIEQATGRAQELAKERNQPLILGKNVPEQQINSAVLDANGKPFSQVIPEQQANMNGQSAQYLKQGLDDMVNSAPQQGIGGNELRAMQNTKSQYIQELEKQLPEYNQANKLFAENSKPINQMDLGNKIADKYIPAIYRDVPIPNQLNHDQLARVLNDNGDGLAQSVTGYKGATLENTLHPNQLKVVQDAVKDANYIKNGQLKGKSAGSSTYQNLAFDSEMGDNGLATLMKLAPLGIVGNVAKAGRDLVYKGANEKLNEKLVQALLNPQDAAALMKSRLNSTQKQQKLIELLRNPALVNAPAVMSAQ